MFLKKKNVMVNFAIIKDNFAILILVRIFFGKSLLICSSLIKKQNAKFNNVEN